MFYFKYKYLENVFQKKAPKKIIEVKPHTMDVVFGTENLFIVLLSMFADTTLLSKKFAIRFCIKRQCLEKKKQGESKEIELLSSFIVYLYFGYSFRY